MFQLGRNAITRAAVVLPLLCGVASLSVSAQGRVFTAAPLTPDGGFWATGKAAAHRPADRPVIVSNVSACKPTIGPGSSPAGGYLGLSLFGIQPLSASDDSVINFNVPTYVYGNQTYSKIGFSSNGYAIVGGATSNADNAYLNQTLPDPAPPNNVIAPFWTDLDPSAAGALRIATLTDGTDDWIVLDWDSVPELSTGLTDQFELWIGYNGVEDISIAYGVMNGDGYNGFATVGFEDATGTVGRMAYLNGAGTRPVVGTQLRIMNCDRIFADGFDL